MITKRFQIIYLALAPVLFGLSWFISHRIYNSFMQSGNGAYEYQGGERSFIYASVFTGLYLSVFLVIRDLYKPKA